MASAALDTRLRRFPGFYALLRTGRTTQDLFAMAAGVAVDEIGVDRAVVLSVTGSQLTALDCGPIEDPASDQLRRRVLGAPVALVRGTEEAELVRRGDVAASRARPQRARSVLAEQLELRSRAYGPVVADGKTHALVVVDREGEIDDADRLWVDLFAAMLAVTLTDVVLRERVAEISAELRHFTASAVALVREATEGSVALPSARGAGPSLPRIAAGAEAASASALFSEREVRVAELLVEGRTNRQIAEELVVSPETVKTHVARILRKLGAHNRAEAVGLFLMLRDQPSTR